jgi:hypothetical protein
MRLLGLFDDTDLAKAEPQLWHLPARLITAPAP